MTSTPQSPGKVFLVGAGCGEAGLITVRGMRLLDQAQVVVYDHLANPDLLNYCPNAEKIYVGKQSACHTRTQEQINALLVDLARQGKRVVRLKGGDPFVFGRGGEECETLAAAGIPFEVVPGITAAIGAPCYAGIPVTHRDFNSSFTIVTGHEKEDSTPRPPGQASDLDWSVLARLPALAFYMGVKALPDICRNLLANGMDPATPAATIRWGATPRQQTIVGTISDLPQKVALAKLAPPALTIVGRVVSLRPTMNWFESRPLFGQTIVVTRTRQQASDLSQRLADLGARIIEAPTIELAPPSNWQPIDAALLDGHFDWVIFTSANGVQFTRQRLAQLNRDVRAFGQAKIAAIGDATAAAIQRDLSLHVDLCPTSFVAEALADALAQSGEIANRRFLLLRADIARPLLQQRLETAGAAEVRDVPIYETRPTPALPPALLEALSAHEVTWITFTSSSTAKNFFSLLPESHRPNLQGVKFASIGPVTSDTLRQLGLSPSVQAETYNIDGLVAALSATAS